MGGQVAGVEIKPPLRGRENSAENHCRNAHSRRSRIFCASYFGFDLHKEVGCVPGCSHGRVPIFPCIDNWLRNYGTRVEKSGNNNRWASLQVKNNGERNRPRDPEIASPASYPSPSPLVLLPTDCRSAISAWWMPSESSFFTAFSNSGKVGKNPGPFPFAPL
jgi:hypothetical protein